MKKSLFLLVVILITSFVQMHANEQRTNHYTQVIVYFVMESLTDEYDAQKYMEAHVRSMAFIHNIMETTDTTMQLHQVGFRASFPMEEDPERDAIMEEHGNVDGRIILAARAWQAMDKALQNSSSIYAQKVQDVKNQTGAEVVTVVILVNNRYYVSHGEDNSPIMVVTNSSNKDNHLSIHNKIIFDETSTKAKAYSGDYPEDHPLYPTYQIRTIFGFNPTHWIYPREGFYKDQHDFWIQVGDDEHNVLDPNHGWKLDYLYNKGDLGLKYGTYSNIFTIEAKQHRHIELFPGWDYENTGDVLYVGGSNFFNDSSTFPDKTHCGYNQIKFYDDPTDFGACAVEFLLFEDAFLIISLKGVLVDKITYASIDETTVPSAVKVGDTFTISLKGDVDLMTSWRPEFEILGVEYEIISSDKYGVTIKVLSAGQMTVTLNHKSLLVLDSESVSVLVEADIQMPDAPELTHTVLSAGTRLDWDVVSSAETYSVYRRADGEDYDQPLVDELESPGYLDDSELPNGVYYYVVTATNQAGESPHSNEVKVLVTSVVEDPLVSRTANKPFPNPAEDLINLPANDGLNKKYVIYNTMGSIAQQGILESNQLQVDRLTAGYYVIEIGNQRFFFIKK
jgi:Secretion system C-terminal sorting domain